MKRLFSLLLISGIMLFNSDTSSAYHDIGGHWSKEYIDVSSRYGVLRGYPDGSFRPDDKVTRAEAAKVLSMSKWGDEFATQDHFIAGLFYDVAFFRDHWAVYEISYMVNHMGTMTGYPDHYFRPDNPITRGELAATIGRGMDGIFNPYISYPDVNSEDWFYNEVNYVSSSKFMNGYPDGTFKPNSYITRGELAKILSVYYYNYYIPTEEEKKEDPYEWAPGIKGIFEQRMIDMGYISSPDELRYEKWDVYESQGHYVVYRKGETHQLVGVNCKTGWFHG